MDNRKVYRAYKSKVVEPYPSKGIFSKVKSLFKRNENDEGSKKRSNGPFSGVTTNNVISSSSSSTASITEPFKFPEPIKIPGSYQDSPSHILSNFFQNKGDQPLNDIEYEGVLSLISRANSPKRTLSSISESQKVSASDRILQNAQFQGKQRHANQSFQSQTNQSFEAVNNQSFYQNSQKVLRNPQPSQVSLYNQTLPTFRVDSANTSVVSGDYTPVYHTIHSSFSRDSVPSVKRVYQFSGLPSPYRTRIRTPNLKRRIETPAPLITPTAQSNYKKPRSATANTLLSMLEKDEPVIQTAKDVKPFANPYSSSKPRNIILTANDINKTIGFDRSEPLEKPKKISTPSIPETQSVNEDVLPKVSKAEFPKSSMQTIPPVKPIIDSIDPPTVGTSISIPSVKPITPAATSTEKTAPAFKFAPPASSSFKFVPQVPSIPSSFKFAPSANVTSSSLPSKPLFSFDFPEAKQVSVDLDSAKVAEYRAYFDFEVHS